MPRQVLHLHTTEEAYERIEHSLLTGSKLGNIATSRPGEVGYMPSVPANYNEAMSGPDAERWKERMRDEAQSLIYHDVLLRPRGLAKFRLRSYTSGSTTRRVYQFSRGAA